LEQAALALAVERDVLPHRVARRIGDVERPEHGVLGRTARSAVVDGIDQHGKAQRVGQQDELLPVLIAHLAGAGQEIDGVVPLALAQIHILGKGMQMLHQRAHHLGKARVDVLAHAAVDGTRSFLR
jgi:hypothetical protein